MESQEVSSAAIHTVKAISPVARADRIESLDVLRGFAVLGILVMNIQSYAMVSAAYSNPHAFGGMTGANYVVWYLSHLLADTKFMGLFSLLFGAGIVLMVDRRQRQGKNVTWFHYRRIFWLLVLGLVHAYAIWFGDILVIYAMTSAIVFWAWRLSPKWQITLALCFLLISSGLTILSGLSMSYWSEQQLSDLSDDWRPSEEEVAEEIALYRGSWSDQLAHRVPMALMFHTFLFGFYFFWRVGGLMLFGMALQKLSILDASRSRTFYLAMTIVGTVLGLPVIGFGIWQNNAHDWDVAYSFFFGSQLNYWGSLLVIVAYIGIVMLACQSGRLKWLARVGQMALTNYLAQSVICTLVFYGHGFGQFGHFSRVQQAILVAALFAFQILFSNWWLGRFCYGPMEWLWRSLTYWKWQPIRLAAQTHPA